MVSINYVIATWSGPRRKGNTPHAKDNTFYLKEHLRLLNKFDHKLDQVTIVAPHNPKESDEVASFVSDGCKQIVRGTKTVVLRRENKGHSYGSYSHSYGMFGNKFDYYIFVEDDYVFPLQNFDSKLINLYENRPNCGFLCGLVTPFGEDNKPHAAISNGIASSEVLSKIWATKGELPSSNYSTTYHCQSQLQFGWAFMEEGFSLHHVIPEYSVIFNDIGTCQVFGRGDPIMIPLQFKNSYPQLA